MKTSLQPRVEQPLSPLRQASLMLVVIAPMAACYPLIDVGLAIAPPLWFALLLFLALAGLLITVALSVFAGRSGPARRANQPGEKPTTEPQRSGNH